MKRSANPFEYGRELSLGELVDRELEMRTIETTIRNHGKLFLIGPRRYGKTSLLAAAEERAKQTGTIVIRLDAEKYESLELLASALLTTALRSLAGPIERAMEKLRRVAAVLEPRITMTGDSVSVGLGVSHARPPLPLLGDALDAVEQLAAESERDVVVVLDEVQQIVVEHGLAAEKQLRATVQKHRHAGYIFAGSSTRLLVEMTSDPNRPFYRMGERLFLGPVPKAEFEAFLRDAFAAHPRPVTDEAIDRILDVAQEVPYNVQRLAHEVWERGLETDRPAIDAAFIDAAAERIVRREDPAYTQIWTALTTNRKKALKAVIEQATDAPFSAESLRLVGLSSSSLKVALNDLERGHLIRTESEEGGRRYRLVDPFFSIWLRVFQA